MGLRPAGASRTPWRIAQLVLCLPLAGALSQGLLLTLARPAGTAALDGLRVLGTPGWLVPLGCLAAILLIQGRLAARPAPPRQST